MRAGAAFRLGVGRVNGAPALVAGLCLMTLLVALPLSLAVRGMIETHLGRSLVAAAADRGDYQWWQEFLSQASGVGSTFTPSIVGFGAVLDNLDAVLDNEPMALTIAGATAAWLVIWSFLSGGVIDRLARERPTRSAGFFAAAGIHFWRFLRLGAIAFGVYAFLFAAVHGWIFERFYADAIRDLSVERRAFLLRLAGYVLFGGLLIFFNAIFDYARIRIVVEDRRSALGAVASGARFVRRHFSTVAALYILNGLALAVVMAIYALLAPGAPTVGPRMWAVLLIGQSYIVGRHYLKLVFYASQTALFQSAVAHAEYTASPTIEWPESPAAERIANAGRAGV